MNDLKRKSPLGAFGGIVGVLARWRLRWKVAAVLALPVCVAAVLAATRIQHELAQAAEFGAAAETAQVVPAVVNLGSAVDTLALTRLGATDPSAAAHEVDTATDELARLLDRSARDHREFDEPLAAVGMLRDRLMIATPPADLATRVEAIHVALLSAVTRAVAVDGAENIDRFTEQFTDAWDARRALTTQRILAETVGDDAAARVRLTFPLGAEAAAIERLAADSAAADVALVADSIQVRQNMFLGDADPVRAPHYTESVTAAARHYDTLLAGIATELVDSADAQAAAARAAALRDTAWVIGALLAALTFALLVAQSLIAPLRRLRLGALHTARRDLPAALERIRAGAAPEGESNTKLALGTGEELDELAQAIDQLHGQAIRLAGEQAATRRQVNDMFETLSRRNRALIDQQLGLIEELEHDEADPSRLRSLFRLDHLVTRMRRNGNNLLVLAGTRVRRNRAVPVDLAEVLQAAMSEVEDFHRVRLLSGPDVEIAGAVAPDLVHLLAELLDNALRFSPPDAAVDLSVAASISGGIVIEIVDTGIGMSDEDMERANRTVAAGGAISVENACRMGLFVVGRLAERHGVTVALRRTSPETVRGGVTAAVGVPAQALVVQTVAPTAFDHGNPLSTRIVRGSGAHALRQHAAPAPDPGRPALPRRVRATDTTGWERPTPGAVPARDPDHIRSQLSQLRSGVDRARRGNGSHDEQTGAGR
ncbi:sensor histidine kinase [Nocardia farcinica]|uniref:sensor histidine kinase n=1 Tax=Nocardia farcinica TaxID=37329 RepID=UPI0024567808|nr:ATP-binding protein [Nocardia farcinica]